ncbi:MAG: cadherin-like domain-containing protein [Colwellia sp.]|nr:cadherin-like domain-containing protein [Colwellia sp.]
MDYSFKKLILVLLVLISYKVQAEPTLHKLIFEFNSRMSVQEEFLIFDGSAVSDPLYSSNELRIQLNGGKTYEAIEFYDKVYTTHGQAAAYNILDFRWIKFKGKLLYIASGTDGNNKMEVIPFRVINPDGETSDWGEIRISLDGRFDQNYDYFPQADNATTAASTSVSINVLANDPAVQSYYQVERFSSPSNGNITFNANKTITYTPNEGFSGVDSFQYWVIGNNLYDVDSAPATVTITVEVANMPPVAVDDTIINLGDGQPVTAFVIANDTDPENDFIYLLPEIGIPSHGTAVFASNQTVKYTPNVGYCGPDSFTYTVTQDVQGTSADIGTVTVICDTPPVAENDAMTIILNGGSVTLDVIANDTDLDGDVLSLLSVGQAAFGQVSIASNKALKYSYAAGTCKNDSFTYIVTDAATNGKTSTGTVTVTCTSTPPVANEDIIAILGDNASVAIDVLANDISFEGKSLTISSVGEPKNGTATITVVNSNQVIVYQPNALRCGPDDFTYNMSDDIGSQWQVQGQVSIVCDKEIPNNSYFFLNPGWVNQTVSIAGLVDNTQVSMNGSNTTVNEGELSSVTVISQSAELSSTMPLSVGTATNALDLPVPGSFKGKSFVVPHVRYHHFYYLLSPYKDVPVTVTIAGVKSIIALKAGITVTFDASDINNIAGIIEANDNILVSHKVTSGANVYDVYSVAPVANEIFGVRNRTVSVGAIEDNTLISVLADNGTTIDYTLQAGKIQTIALGSNLAQGAGSAFRITSDKPISAVQIADADGGETTAFLPQQFLATSYLVPVDAQYLAIVCPQANTVIKRYSINNELLESSMCNTSGTGLGKAYFGSETNGVHIDQGEKIKSSAPIYLIYEASSSNDEHNLLGANTELMWGKILLIQTDLLGKSVANGAVQ